MSTAHSQLLLMSSLKSGELFFDVVNIVIYLKFDFRSIGGPNGVAAPYHNGVGAIAPASIALGVTGSETLSSALGIVVDETATLEFEFAAQQPSTDASHRFAAAIAFPNDVQVSNARVGGSMASCQVGNANAGGQCGLRCSLGSLSSMPSILSFDALLPSSSSLKALRTPICACLDDADDIVAQTGFCFLAGDIGSFVDVIRFVYLSMHRYACGAGCRFVGIGD